MKKFYLPLPERRQVSAAALAHEVIDSWLSIPARKARNDAIAAYAAELAGTDVDLDRDLEAASIENLMR